MIYSLLLPFLMGGFGVLQNALLKRDAGTAGMPLVLLVNNLVLLACSGILLLALRFATTDAIPEIFRSRQGWQAIGLKSLIPGLLGFTIIAVLPVAIEKVGAMRVFIVVIAAQIVVSSLWDRYVEALPLGGWRILGAALTLAGAAMATL